MEPVHPQCPTVSRECPEAKHSEAQARGRLERRLELEMSFQDAHGALSCSNPLIDSDVPT